MTTLIRRRLELKPSSSPARALRDRLVPAGLRGRTRPPFAAPEPDLDDIFGERPPPFVRHTHYVVAGMLAALVGIASLVDIDIIISASGRLTTDAPTVVLQPMQLSVIRNLRIKPGDVVHKGDILATLDPTFAQADQVALASQKMALDAQIARLEAELDDRMLKLDASTPDSQLQQTLYHQRQSERAARLRAFDEDGQRYKSTMLAAAVNSESLAQQIDIAKQMEEMHSTLVSKKIEAKVSYLDAAVTRMRAEREKQDAEIQMNEARHNLLAREADRQVFIDQWRSQLLDDLVKARKDQKGVAENLVKATRMSDLVTITAPEDGIVLDVAKRSVGSVMQPAEPLVTLVPSDAVLIADIMIASADVGYAKTGDEVVVKVDAFPYQRHGTLEGRLRTIGADSSFASSTGVSGTAQGGAQSGPLIHRSQVDFTSTKLRALPEGAHLMPGMTLTAEIKVGQRSIISYFLYPITRGLDESIREP